MLIIKLLYIDNQSLNNNYYTNYFTILTVVVGKEYKFEFWV